MKRYILDYDDTLVPPGGTDAVAAVVSGLIDFRKKGNRIVEAKDPFVYPLANQIVVKQGAIFSLFNSEWRTFEIDEEIILGAGNLDTGTSFTVGTDYYIYLVDNSQTGELVISANTTFPQGESADNVRKIGGFHFGHVRCVNERWTPISPAGTPFGSDGVGWKKNVVVGIVPNSVWDINDKPPMPGMASVGNTWRFIYPASQEEAISFENNADGLFIATGKLQSKYGQIPVTGSEGLHWYSFCELAAKQGLRLPTYAEFIQGAYGNPGGQDSLDEFGWTKNSNAARVRTGCNVDQSTGLYIPSGGIKPFAVSAYNLVDCVGNVWEWVDELTGTGGPGWYDDLGADKGQRHCSDLKALLCGGNWGNGVTAGPRAVNLDYFPWGVYTDVGCRLACDKLAA